MKKETWKQIFQIVLTILTATRNLDKLLQAFEQGIGGHTKTSVSSQSLFSRRISEA